VRDPFPIVCKLGDRLQGERTGWRDVKALVLLVARAGDWNGASALAEALGVSPDAQEQIYREAQQPPAGGATPAPFPHRRQKATTP